MGRRQQPAARGAANLAGAFVLGGACAFALSGCFWFVPRSQGDELQRGLDGMRERLDKLESQTAEERRRLTEMVTRADQGVNDLNRVLKQATGVLTRNSADFGAQVQSFGERLRELTGQLEEIRHGLETLQRDVTTARQDVATTQADVQTKLAQFAKRAGIDFPIDASRIPADRTDHYAAAYRAYTQRDYGTARALFREFLARYPRDDQADNAQYWIGVSFLDESRASAAIGELQKVIDNYPQGDAVDDAMVAMADGFFRLRSCTEARQLLNEAIRLYPTSPVVPRAREKLAEIQRAPREACTGGTGGPSKSPPEPGPRPGKQAPR